MKKYLFLLVFIVSFSFGYGQRYNVTELSTSDNKYTLNGAYYSGKAYSLTKKAQLKEEFTIENGMLNGLYELYKTDENYTHSKYKDTLLISRTINNIEELELKIKELQKDSIRKLDSVWNQEEELIGGRIFKQTESIEVLKRKEKLKSIEEKYVDDKLNNKKTIEYNKYVESQKEFTNCHVMLVLKRSELKQKNEVLNMERGKPMFQNTLSETYYYVAGNQTGIHSVYDKSGNKEIEETLNNSKKDGAFKKYSGNKIVEEGNYVNNEKDGEWTTLNSSEKITQNYSKGKLNGSYKKYDSEVLRESGQYVEGLKNGEWENFDYYGKLLEVKNYKSDKLDGAFKKYFGDVVIEEGTYSNGLMNGEWKFYYNSGKIKGSGKFLNSDGGDLGSTGIPKNGRDGLWISYHENGNKSQECSYVQGKIEGKFISYHENGKKSQECNYLNGKENGSFISYYENGNLKWQYNYILGERDKETLTTKYYENGKKEYEGYYDGTNWHGSLNEYREDGTLKIYEHYYDGKLGFRNFYRSDGKTYEKSESYKNGKYWFTTYYDESGNKIEKEDSYSSNYTRSNSSYTKVMCNGVIWDKDIGDDVVEMDIELICPYCSENVKHGRVNYYFHYQKGRNNESDCDWDEYTCTYCGKVSIMKPCLIKHLNKRDKF